MTPAFRGRRCAVQIHNAYVPKFLEQMPAGGRRSQSAGRRRRGNRAAGSETEDLGQSRNRPVRPPMAAGQWEAYDSGRRPKRRPGAVPHPFRRDPSPLPRMTPGKCACCDGSHSDPELATDNDRASDPGGHRRAGSGSRERGCCEFRARCEEPEHRHRCDRLGRSISGGLCRRGARCGAAARIRAEYRRSLQLSLKKNGTGAIFPICLRARKTVTAPMFTQSVGEQWSRHSNTLLALGGRGISKTHGVRT